MGRAEGSSHRFGNLFIIQAAPDAGDDNLAQALVQRLQGRREFFAFDQWAVQVTRPGRNQRGRQGLVSPPPPGGASHANGPVAHHPVQPGRNAARQFRLPRQFHKCFLHAVVWRVGPLRCKNDERPPLLIEQAAQQLGR